MYKLIIILVVTLAAIAAPVSAFSPSINRCSVATGASSTRVFAVSKKGMQSEVVYSYVKMLVCSRKSKLTITNPPLFFLQLDDKKPLEIVGESSPESSEEEIQAALDNFKLQSQIKAFVVLGVAFGTFVYLKLQYDADPSHFIGSH